MNRVEFTAHSLQVKQLMKRKMSVCPLLCLMLFALAACAGGRRSFHRAEEFHTKGKYEEAINAYAKAMNRNPREARYRLKLMETIVEAANFYYRQALEHIREGDQKVALYELNKALEYNPAHVPAREEKKMLLKKMEAGAQEKEQTTLEELKNKTSIEKTLVVAEKEDKVSLRFDKEIDVDKVFKALAQTEGVNIIFDGSFRNSKISVVLEGITFRQALERVCMLKELFYKYLDPQTIIVVADSEAKHRVFDEQIIKNFYLSNIKAEECAKLLTRVSKINAANVVADSEQNSITVRDVPDKVALAERLIRFYDKRRAEVMIKVEILEVNKDKLKEYGSEFSQYQVTQGLIPSTDKGGIKGNRFHYLDSSDFLYTIPNVIYKLLENDTDSKVMAWPHVRGEDAEKIEIKVGDKVPVPRTTFMPFSTGGVEQHPITQFDLQDVGIDIVLVPKIHHDAEISLELDFKMTFITSPGSSSIPPTIGNRSVKTKIRLKDGETGVMAGLLRDAERNSLKGFPGIVNIPVLREIFAANTRQISQTDIILSITPYIIRMPDIAEEDLQAIPSGSEANVHFQKKQ